MCRPFRYPRNVNMRLDLTQPRWFLRVFSMPTAHLLVLSVHDDGLRCLLVKEELLSGVGATKLLDKAELSDELIPAILNLAPAKTRQPG